MAGNLGKPSGWEETGKTPSLGEPPTLPVSSSNGPLGSFVGFVVGTVIVVAVGAIYSHFLIDLAEWGWGVGGSIIN